VIIVRSPLRISLGGGGTDLPSYYTKHTGFAVSAAITRYVYITISDGFWPRIHLKYSKMEDVERVEEIHHPIIRESMKLTGVMGPYLEIVSLSDIPAGTGLGSSGKFYHSAAERIAHAEETVCVATGTRGAGLPD
jgi:D-glycero-alpha-D-manno-heptose-7-phosphate kinase